MMKKAFKILLKLFFVAFLIVFSMLAYIVYQLETSIDGVLSKEQQNYLFSAVENTEELPEIFYLTVEKYYPDFFNYTFWNTSLSALSSNNRKFCQCHSIYLPYIPGESLEQIEKFPFNSRIPTRRPVITLELEERFTQKQCFTYSMSISNFGDNTQGIKDAAKYFFKKDLKDLNEREIISFLFMEKAPAMYNPRIHRDRLDKAVDRILKQ